MGGVTIECRDAGTGRPLVVGEGRIETGGSEREERASAWSRLTELNIRSTSPSFDDPRGAFPRKGAYYQRWSARPLIQEETDPRKYLRDSTEMTF